ncbi:MAG: glucuronate isomerase [Candidatus Marinimicrobia bacterium]|nr:glucuronate isomerase [Candidatus Neomarinimicrobiota bacterium]
MMGSRLHPHRFFDPNYAIRNMAHELYDGVKNLPIISPHGHTDPKWFAENKPFSDPTNLLITPDHYVLRMLYSQGVAFEDLGIARSDGSPVEQNPRKVWDLFAKHYYLFSGTPVGSWFDHVFHDVFGINETLDENTSTEFYRQINLALKSPDFLPRSIIESFNIEVIATTDRVTDTLEFHQDILDSGWKGKVIPTFRPDSVIDILDTDWKQTIIYLGELAGIEINSYTAYIAALEERRKTFKSLGATATDHGVLSPYTHRLSDQEANSLFSKALKGTADPTDAQAFTAHMLMEMARMSMEDGLVMQIHPGSFRNHNKQVFELFGADMGGDIPTQTEYTKNLYELLNAYGNDPHLKLIIFTLDESNYTRELAPLAAHYPALKLGPAWWFNDSIEGMRRFRQMTTETASIYNTVGFNDDTRALMSIPARHDLSRRVDSNYLATLVASHRIDMADARIMSRAMAYDLAKHAYNL